MSQIIEVKVPDIGNFKDVPIIDVLVKVGDTVKAEDALLTLESDKATIDIPSPADGVIAELTVKVGDKVSEGSLVARMTSGAAENNAGTPAASASQPAPAPVQTAPAAAPAPATPVSAPAAAGSYSGAVDVECDLLVLGAGPGGTRPPSAAPTSGSRP